MSVSFAEESEDLFVVSIEGVLTFDELMEIENKFAAAIDRSRKIKGLILAEDFSGWAKEGDWGNLEFMLKYDPYIQKIAVVANEEKKNDLLLYLGKGMREASVEFFPAGEKQKARDWLQLQTE
jgi:hypothetical protein